MPFDSKTMRVVSAKPGNRIGNRVQRNDTNDAFSDLLIVLPTLSVAEIVELIESGEADVDDVVRAERVGKARKTVLALVKTDSGKVYPVFGKANSNPFAE